MDDRGETPWYWLGVGSLTSDSIRSNLQFGSSQPKFVRRSLSSGQTRCHASVYPAAPPNKGIGPEVVERGKLMDSIFRDDSGQSNVMRQLRSRYSRLPCPDRHRTIIVNRAKIPRSSSNYMAGLARSQLRTQVPHGASAHLDWR